ncbi:ChaB family protein [Paeniglutamicibacter antarcticus]|uniref:ChaB family protein n=1 Tax=Arthrobacter terrae TaxID=2935737 RepID=A0A931G9Z0_9MICC|nr:ChaB family protein [Arthrobacter terrae]MBG0741569.1 ChaB family protein [Arthrobacter terrae]
MPKSDKSGHPRNSELPGTLQRSSEHAQATFAQTYDSAMGEYDDAERAARTAYASLKHSYEKVGDRWEAKDQAGPSDSQAKGGKDTDLPTAGGVDANASKEHLYELAKKLHVPGRSGMGKGELVDALQKARERKTRQSRSGESNE